MFRSSLVRQPVGLLLGLAWLLLPQLLPSGHAAEESTQVRFETKDGVQLQGTFYPTSKGKDEPTVLLLHKLSGNSHQDGWDSLAEALQKKGYSVLSFDFRGHGKSTSVDQRFWTFPWNRLKGGGHSTKLKESISSKDFPPSYYPYLVNDIAAARMFLDERHEAGECNSHALILIGAEEGATLGSLWMYSEWFRHPAALIEQPGLPPFIRSVEQDVEGKDQFCAIWLTVSATLGGRRVGTALDRSLITVGRDKKIPMAFLYGAKDERGEGSARYYLKLLKGAEKDPRGTSHVLPCTNIQKVPDTKLTGSALLHPDLGMQTWIADKYLPFVRDKNVPNRWGRRDLDRTSYVWAFGLSRPTLAKSERGKYLEPIPLNLLGLQIP
jgi:hypothetical protein